MMVSISRVASIYQFSALLTSAYFKMSLLINGCNIYQHLFIRVIYNTTPLNKVTCLLVETTYDLHIIRIETVVTVSLR